MLSILVVVGEMVLDETDAPMDTTGIAVVTRGTADTILVVETAAPMEVAVLTELPMGVVNTAGTTAAPDEVVIDSLEGALATEAMIGTEGIGAVEAIAGVSEEGIEVVIWRGDTALVDVMEAVVVEVEGVDEAVAVETIDMIGVTI